MTVIQIVIFSDYICPFCFLANEIVKRIRPKFDLEITWRPFELHPIRMMMPKIDSQYIQMAWQSVLRLANAYQITIKLPKFLSISRKALETAEFAREYGKFDDCHNQIFNAYFLEGKDIEKEETLLKIITQLGLNPEVLKQKWREEIYHHLILESIHELHSAGITAVPTFFIGNDEPRIVVSVHPQEKIEKVIFKAQADLGK